MATLDRNDKLIEEQPNSTNSAPLTGGASTDVGSGVSTAGVGAGGQGGWTNIQAYLKANEGNTNSANALSNQIGSEFQGEESKILDSSSQAKSQAEANRIGSFTEKELNNSIYAPDSLKTMKDYFAKSYQGPESYNYSLGQKAQEYGEQLGDDQRFGALLGDVYNNAAGGRISTGQMALQRQLDTNNPALQEARQSLNSRYSALNNMANQVNQETNQAIEDSKATYKAQDEARNYYTQQSKEAKQNYDHYMDLTNNTGWHPKGGNMVEPWATRYNTIQQFLGQNNTLAIPDKPEDFEGVSDFIRDVNAKQGARPLGTSSGSKS